MSQSVHLRRAADVLQASCESDTSLGAALLGAKGHVARAARCSFGNRLLQGHPTLRLLVATSYPLVLHFLWKERGDLDEAARLLFEAYDILQEAGSLESVEAAQICTRIGPSAAQRLSMSECVRKLRDSLDQIQYHRHLLRSCEAAKQGPRGGRVFLQPGRY